MPPAETTILSQFYDLIVKVPIVPSLLFFFFSLIGKVIVRSESLPNRSSLYIIFTNGSQLALLSVAIPFATAIVKANNGYHAQANRLLVLALFLLIGFFLVCGLEAGCNDISNPRFHTLKEGWGGLWIPTLAGGAMVWVAILCI